MTKLQFMLIINRLISYIDVVDVIVIVFILGVNGGVKSIC